MGQRGGSRRSGRHSSRSGDPTDGETKRGLVVVAVVNIDRREGYAILTINRPEALNALNREVLETLQEALITTESDSSMRALIVTGAGRAFVAGADIREIQAIPSPPAAEAFSRWGQNIMTRLAESRLVSFMAINGFALGGGLELAMAGDYRIMADSAELGQPEILLGIIPGFGGTQRLKDLCGEGRALWLIASGDRINAERAHALGIVDEVCPADGVMPRAEAMAATLATRAPLALEAAKRAVRAEGGMAHRLKFEAAAFGLIGCSDDAREGTAAFLEKRRPRFQGS